MTIAVYRKKITEQLFPHTDSARADAELLLMRALNKTRTELITESLQPVSDLEAESIEALVHRRLAGEPIAYILGHQGFWTLDLMVTPDTLVPRPETECLVEWVLHAFSDRAELILADLGTGSGAIALALATEKPAWKIDATDESYEALAIARKNANQYCINNVSFYPGDWCDALPDKKYDIIISNPPYIPEGDAHLLHLKFEPHTALVSGLDGLDAIKKIVKQAKNYLKPKGVLVIEHGYDQALVVANIFKHAGYHEVHNHRDLSDVPRFVTGIYG